MHEVVKRAIAARDVQAMMAHPSDKMIKHLVSSTNMVKYLDTSVPAISNAQQLFGPDWRSEGENCLTETKCGAARVCCNST
jgi:hypothetical protein